MSQIIRCNYHNNTKQFQLVKIVDSLLWVEKICTPGKVVSFDAYINSKVEIYSCYGATMLREETIPAANLADISLQQIHLH